MPAVSQVRNDWSRDEVLALFALPFTELLHRAGTVHREHFDPDRGPGLHAAVGEDRRLPRGLRLLPAGRALPHRRRRHEADEHRGRGREGPPGARRRRLALLHGRRVALAEGPRHPEGRRDDPRGEGARPGNLRDARHAQPATRRTRCATPAWTTTTTTSTPRRSSTARSSTRASSRTAWTRCRTCATRA